MSWLETVGRIVGFIWLLPATTVVWAGYVLPLWTLGYIEHESTRGGIVTFRLDAPGSYYQDVLWRRWAGWSGPCCILYKPVTDARQWSRNAQILAHERRHCVQQFWFGAFFYPAYCAALFWIYLFERRAHPYYDNPFERDARRAAGETLDPRRRTLDRWPWW